MTRLIIAALLVLSATACGGGSTKVSAKILSGHLEPVAPVPTVEQAAPTPKPKTVEGSTAGGSRRCRRGSRADVDMTWS